MLCSQPKEPERVVERIEKRRETEQLPLRFGRGEGETVEQPDRIHCSRRKTVQKEGAGDDGSSFAAAVEVPRARLPGYSHRRVINMRVDDFGHTHVEEGLDQKQRVG